MEKKLIAVGKLVGTSDMNAATKLGKLFKLEVRPGQKVSRIRDCRETVVFTTGHEVYELSAA